MSSQLNMLNLEGFPQVSIVHSLKALCKTRSDFKTGDGKAINTPTSLEGNQNTMVFWFRNPLPLVKLLLRARKLNCFYDLIWKLLPFKIPTLKQNPLFLLYLSTVRKWQATCIFQKGANVLRMMWCCPRAYQGSMVKHFLGKTQPVKDWAAGERQSGPSQERLWSPHHTSPCFSLQRLPGMVLSYIEIKNEADNI